MAPLKRILPLLLFLFFSSLAQAYQQIEFISEFGEFDKKTKQHQLNAPRGIALAGDKIYVADTGAHRVLIMDLSGKTIRTWGAKGDKPGQFKSPAGIAVDEQGRVYVADTGNNRIQVFNAEGKPVRSIGAKGSAPREFSSPSGIFVQRGFLYVADTGNSRVQVLSADGIFLKQIEVKGKKDEMKAPVAVAADLQNRLYVLDEEMNMVRIFDQDGAELDHFGVEGRGTEGFDNPRGLAVDAYGNIYIGDTGNYKLKKLDAKGKLVASLGCEGEGPGQFREAAALAVDRDGRVYVLDAEKNTLQIFATEKDEVPPLAQAAPPVAVEIQKELSGIAGELHALASSDKELLALVNDSIRVVAVPGGRSIGPGTRGSAPSFLKNPLGLTVDSAGNYWVADTGNDRLQKFSPDGQLLQVVGKSGSGEGQFDSPSALAIGGKGNIYVADTGNRRIQVFNAKGMFLGMFGKEGNLPGQFEEPVDLAVNGSDFLYVVDRENNRIGKFDSNGTLLWEAGKAGAQDGEFDSPSNIRVSPDGEVYVLDSGNARIQVFNGNGKFLRAFGSEGKEPGQFKSPRGLALDGVRLFVGDAGNARVQVFTLRQTPAVPRDLTAQARVNEIQLSWKSNSESFLERYQIYRSESAGGPFSIAGASTDPFFVDKGLASNKTFFYRVTGKAREGNESIASTPVSATTPRLLPGSPRKVLIEAMEKQMTVSWLPNMEPFVTNYRIYRSRQLSSGFELLAQTDRTVYIDNRLDDETFYYYQITAVGKEGDESPASEIVYAATPKASLTLPPIEIASVEVGAIFASAYKYYESHAAGKVIIRNNTETDFPRIKLSFSIKDFMDYPTEIDIDQVPAKGQVELQLKPVFSNKILDVTENTSVQSELSITYYVAGEAKTVTRSFPVTLYERHAMVWDEKAKLGAFVTPKDPPVADFSRSVIRSYVDTYPNLHQSVVYGRAIYSALGVMGLKYIVDPTSPFQEFSEKSSSVDYLQCPRDTLARKSGDCDDLSLLFAAAMENIGIETAFVDVPGHVFVMFNTGVPEKDKSTLGFPVQQLVTYEGSVWIPVEMTMVGSSFTRSWQKAAEQYRDWTAKGKAEIIHTQKAWETFKPVTLPTPDGKAAKVSREEIEALFKDELEALGRQRLSSLSAGYLETLKKNPNNADALAQLGILYGENGLYAEALEQFQKILAKDKGNSLALNNIGNINFLQERLEDAKLAYEASLKSSPDDTGTMVNLARVLDRIGKKEDARKLLKEAAATDPRIFRQYPDLPASLGIGK
jgi:DNA-binding beta-propeller fold protein YncE